MADRPNLDLLDETYQMVRLHGWCAQTYDLLDRLAGAATREQAQSAGEIVAEIQQRLRTASSPDERILSIALLHDRGVPPADTADLVYRNLNGRLSDQGFAFLQRYLYHNVPPVPDQIIYEITQRVFISYQRAVFQAMRISEFTSDRAPDLVVLYLTMLLCRDSLNQQNRAMVHLLLSRIDATLPRSLAEAVAGAMKDLRDVVRQVEERQESVLSDALEPDTQPRAVDWQRAPGAPATRSPGPSSAAPAAATPAGPPDKAQDWAAMHPATRGRAAPEGPAVGAPPAAMVGARDRVWEEGDRTTGAAEGGARSPAAEVSSAAPRQRGDQERLGPRQGEYGGQPAAEPPAPGVYGRAGLEAQIQSGTPDVEAREPRAAASRGQARAAGRLFAIRFSRQTTELAALLDTLRQKVSSEGKRASSGAAATKHSRPARGDRPVRPKESRRWVWLIAAAFLLGTGGVLIMLLGKRPAPLPQPTPPPAAALQPAEVGPAAPDVRASPEAPPEPEQGRAGPDLRVVNSDTVWYPRLGESLWRLYTLLKDGAAQEAGLKALSSLDWHGFVTRISELNPDLAVPDLIQAEVPIVVLEGSP